MSISQIKAFYPQKPLRFKLSWRSSFLEALNSSDNGDYEIAHSACQQVCVWSPHAPGVFAPVVPWGGRPSELRIFGQVVGQQTGVLDKF